MIGCRDIIAVLGAITVSVLAGALPAQAGKSDDTLVAAFRRGLDKVDYLFATRRESIIVSRLTDDGLVMVDPESFEVVPLAARSYKFVDDRTIDFEIRPGVKFHDGSPLTADDVVYTYNWVLDRRSGAARGRQIRDWLESVEKTGNMSVRFRMKYPYPLALRDIAYAVQLRKQGTYDRSNRKTATGTQQRLLNGTGPYRVVSLKHGNSVVLERFADYYRDSPKGWPAISRIVFRAIPDWVTQQSELLSGGVDLMFNVPSDIALIVGGIGRASHLTGPSLRVAFIPLDAANLTGQDNNPFTSIDVRRAFIHAINREAIVRDIVKGGAMVIHSACHPTQFGCTQDVTRYPYDPRKAWQLLKAAGYPNGFSFDLWVYRERPVALAIIDDLAKVGIRARMRFETAGRLATGRKRHEVAAYLGTWGSGGTADTAMIARPHWALSSNRNLSGDREVAKDIAGANRTLDPEQRKRLYRQGLRRIADQAYWAPLYAFTINYLTSKALRFPVPKDGMPRLFRASWKQP